MYGNCGPYYHLRRLNIGVICELCILLSVPQCASCSDSGKPRLSVRHEHDLYAYTLSNTVFDENLVLTWPLWRRT
ncbi:hypothetical protein V1508DRAFT_74365 [Lipomyces doorenjongii]|uniref:uncharacterized protein n=1 Tax=Lipomyces doorenjongii TaxID=383834 RepID=UPI0034CF9DB1